MWILIKMLGSFRIKVKAEARTSSHLITQSTLLARMNLIARNETSIKGSGHPVGSLHTDPPLLVLRWDTWLHPEVLALCKCSVPGDTGLGL